MRRSEAPEGLLDGGEGHEGGQGLGKVLEIVRAVESAFDATNAVAPRRLVHRSGGAIRSDRQVVRGGYFPRSAHTVAPPPERALRPALLEAVPGDKMKLVSGANLL